MSSMGKYRYTEEDLAAAVASSTSIAGVMRVLGILPAGGSHFHISKRIRKAGLDTSHFLGKASSRGQNFARLTAEEILIKRDPGHPRTKPHLLRRALLETGIPARCSECKTTNRWMDAPLVLHVDHIDGDSSNNDIENLRFLCPNCHSQTASYCRKRSSPRRLNQLLE